MTYSNSPISRILVLGGLVLACAVPSWAQWHTQQITLEPGWNAVFLEVEPSPRDLDSVFDGIPVESVWAWNQSFDSIQFVVDPNTLVAGAPEWLQYRPPSDPIAFRNDLFILLGGRAYLIKLGGSDPFIWTVTGRPDIRLTDWLPDSYNLVGFHLDSSAPPTFQDFFAPSGQQNGQEMYRLNSAGDWGLVTDPATTAMREGEAYWVFSDGASNYSGPFVALSDLGGSELDFELVVTSIALRMKNMSAATRTVVLTPFSSDPPPNPSEPEFAGSVPLHYLDTSTTNAAFVWVPFTEPFSVIVEPGEVAQLDIQIRRIDLDSFTASTEDSLSDYQSLLQISDGAGTELIFPVRAENPGPVTFFSVAGGGTSLRITGPSVPTAVADPRGLWVGDATITAVSQPANTTDSTTPFAAEGELSFRLIIHVDASGQARLLQQALLMFEAGTLIDDPNDPSNPPSKIVDRQGRFVLLTDDSLIPQFSGSALRDGETVGRRISTSAFAMKQPLDMTGTFGSTTTPLNAVVFLPYTDSLNPFNHLFHPDHDNLNRRFDQTLPAGKESFDITREIDLTFMDADPNGFQIAGYGSTHIGGTYRERLSGLHRDDIFIEGTFRLNRIAVVDQLNQ